MGFEIQGSGGGAGVTSTAAGLTVALPVTTPLTGFTSPASEVDSGSVTGTRLMRQLEASNDYRLRVGVDTLVFSEPFPGAALNSAIWTAPVTTMTATVANGFVTLNAGLSTASAAVARVSSYRSFPVYGTSSLYGELIAQFAQQPVTNNVTEMGFGIATGTTAPTDGAIFRLYANGDFKCVVINNSVEVQSAALNFASLVGLTSHHFLVSITDDDADFWIDDVLVASVPRPSSGSTITASQNLPVLMRTYNTSATSAAQVLKVGGVDVTLADVNISKPWPQVRAGAGDMGYQGPTGGTMGSTALFTNSLAAGAGAAATNTTAALGTGLGGQFSLQPTLTAGTDGIISSYQVPLGTAALPGKTLYITGLRIQGVVTTALTGGPLLGVWSAAFGHTAVSLATAEAATTKAPRRVPLGIQTYPVTSAVGTQADRDLVVQFQTPIVVQPGEFFQTVNKNLGTVTSAGVVTFVITVDAYWE